MAETLPHMSDKAINSAIKQVDIELDAQGLRILPCEFAIYKIR